MAHGLDTTLLVPTPDDDHPPGSWVEVQRDVLTVAMHEDDLGLLLPGFTSTAALATWRPEGGAYVVRDASWFFGVATADPTGRVAIDPGSDGERILGPEEVARLAVGPLWGSDESDDATTDGSALTAATSAATPTGMLVATPVDGLADEVAGAVTGALAEEPAVVSARLLLLDPSGEGLQPTVAVDLGPLADTSGVGPTMERIVTSIAERTEAAGGLTFVVVTDDWRDAYESGGIVLA